MSESSPKADGVGAEGGGEPSAGARAKRERPRLKKVKSTLGKRILAAGCRASTRWWWRVGLGLPILLTLVVVVVAVAIPQRVVLPIVSRAVGLEISADRVLLLNRDLDLVMENVRVRVPGIEGPAGEVARSRILRASYDWTSLTSGGALFDSVRLVGPVIRISQDAETGDLNLESLPVRGSAARGGAFPKLPELVIVSSPIGDRDFRPESAGEFGDDAPTRGRFGGRELDAAIEIGEHRDGSYVRLWRVPVAGRLVPSGDAGMYAIELTGLTDAASDERVSITGTTGIDGTRVEVRDVSLSIDPERVFSRSRETFAAFALDGSVPELVFEQPPGADPFVEVTLEGVGLTLPFSAVGGEGVRLEGTDGKLRLIDGAFEGEVAGVAEDVAYEVVFETGAVDASTFTEVPFELTARVTDYELPPDPPVVPFLPPLVQLRLDQFSNPTGLVTAEISLRRDRPGAKIAYSGRVRVVEGRAAYFRFPYEFEDLTAEVSFDASALVIERVEGTAPSGATVVATGRFAPLDSTSEVDLAIDVAGIPLDETFERAVTGDRKRVLDMLLSREGLASIESQGLVPEGFEFGGEGGVSIRLHRQLGKESVWTRRFTIEVPEARLLPDLYRTPIYARDVRIEMSERAIESIEGSFRTADGATGAVSGGALLSDPETGRGVFRPSMRVDATDVVVGPAMVAALESTADGEASRIIGELGLAGRTSGGVSLTTADDGSLGFEIDASLDGVSASPGTDGASDGARAEAVIDASRGSVLITREGLDVAVEGFASRVDPGPIVRTTGGRVSFDASSSVRWFGRDEGRFLFDAVAPAFDVSIPVEGVARVFSGELASTIAAQRRAWRPTGTGRVELRYEQPAERSEDASLDVAVSGPASLSVTVPEVAADAFGENAFWVDAGRLGLREVSGRAGLSMRLAGGSAESSAVDESASARDGGVRGASLRFEGFGGEVVAGDARAAGVRADGVFGLVGSAATSDDEPNAVRVEVGGVAIESPAVRLVGGLIAGEGLVELYDEFKPAGEADATLSLSRADDGVVEPRGRVTFGAVSIERTLPSFLADTAVEGGASAEVGTGGIAADPVASPEGSSGGSVSTVAEGPSDAVRYRLAFDRVDGELRIEPNVILVEDVVAGAETLVGSVSGALRYGSRRGPAGEGGAVSGLSGDFRLALRADRVTDELRAIAPSALRDAMDALEFGSTGSVEIPDMRLTFEVGADGSDPEIVERSGEGAPPAVSFRATGVANVRGGHARLGVPVDEADGSALFDVVGEPGRAVSYQAEPRVRSADVLEIRVTDISGLVSSRPGVGNPAEPGNIVVEGVEGVSHGGRVALEAAVSPSGRYDASIRAGDIGLSGVLSDFERAADPSAPTRRDTGALLGGRLTVGGQTCDPASLRGRGDVSFRGGTVVQMPITLALIRAGLFQVPTGEALDDGSMRFFVDGDLVTFEDISLTSGSLTLLGVGTYTLSEKYIDLSFVTRSSARLPVVSDVFEGLRDEFVTATIRGPIDDRRVGTEQFSLSRRLMRELFDVPPTPEQASLEAFRDRLGPRRLDRWRWSASTRAFEPESGLGQGLESGVGTEVGAERATEPMPARRVGETPPPRAERSGVDTVAGATTPEGPQP